MAKSPYQTLPRLCLLVEDQPRTRDWLLGVLTTAFPGIGVVAQPSLRAARFWLDAAAARGGEPGFTLALIDLGLPDGSGVELLRRLAADWPEVLPVVATIYDDDAHLFEAIAAGARGYVLKEEDPGMMAACLRRIERGEPPLSPSIAHRLLAHFRDRPVQPGTAERADDCHLTPRETETLALLARGLTVAEAAERMALRPQTVASYVKIIYQKLNVTTRAAATREAVRRGLA